MSMAGRCHIIEDGFEVLAAAKTDRKAQVFVSRFLRDHGMYRQAELESCESGRRIKYTAENVMKVLKYEKMITVISDGVQVITTMPRELI